MRFAVHLGKNSLFLLSGSCGRWLRSRSKECLRKDRGVVVADLPLSLFVYVNEGVSGLDLVSSGTHGEFVDSVVLAPVVSCGDVGFEDLSLGLLLQEIDEVVVDGIVVSSGDVRNSGQEAGAARVTLGNGIGITGGKGVVPEVEESANLVFGDSNGLAGLRHDRRVVLADLPFSILEDVDESVTSLDLSTVGSHGELVDSGILGPVLSNDNVAGDDLSLGLKFQEVDEVVLDSVVISTGNVRDSRQKNSFPGITGSDLAGVKSGESIIPQVEKSLDFLLGNGLAHSDGLRHDRRVVVADLPVSVLRNVDEGVTSLYLITGGTHGEFVDTAVTGPVLSDTDIGLKDSSLGLLLKEGVKVVLDSVEVSTGLVRNSGQKASGLSVTVGNDAAVTSGKSIVPKAEKGLYLILRDVRSGSSSLSLAAEKFADSKSSGGLLSGSKAISDGGGYEGIASWCNSGESTGRRCKKENRCGDTEFHYCCFN